MDLKHKLMILNGHPTPLLDLHLLPMTVELRFGIYSLILFNHKSLILILMQMVRESVLQEQLLDLDLQVLHLRLFYLVISLVRLMFTEVED